MKRRKFSEKAQRRSDLYGLLSSVYSREPDPTFIQHLRENFFRSFLNEEKEGDDKFWGQPVDKICQDLAVEYARLFIGPKDHIPPYESLYNYRQGEKRQIWGEATVNVKRMIEVSGLSFKADYGGIPDHLGIELEFMEKLVRKEAELWTKRNSDDQLLRALQMERKFVDDHLGKWIPEFCPLVIGAAALDFYKNFARLTMDFIDLEKEDVENLLSIFSDNSE